jgi:hypothetical protein
VAAAEKKFCENLGPIEALRAWMLGYIRWNGLKQAKRLTVRIDSKHAGLPLTV